jgi:hypothetical protein
VGFQNMVQYYLEEVTHDDRLDFDLSTTHCWVDGGLERESEGFDVEMY